MKRILVLAFPALLVLASTARSQAAELVYSMTGGTITGTLNGVAFNSVGYSIRTTANPEMIKSYSVSGVVPSTYLIATTSMIIAGFDAFTFSDPLFGVAAANLNAISAGDSLAGFATQLGTDNSTGLGPIGAGAFLSLATPNSFSGDLITFTGLVSPGSATWVTSAGTLNITATSGVATVTVANVPEPGSFVLAALAAAGLALATRRGQSRRPR